MEALTSSGKPPHEISRMRRGNGRYSFPFGKPAIPTFAKAGRSILNYFMLAMPPENHPLTSLGGHYSYGRFTKQAQPCYQPPTSVFSSSIGIQSFVAFQLQDNCNLRTFRCTSKGTSSVPQRLRSLLIPTTGYPSRTVHHSGGRCSRVNASTLRHHQQVSTVLSVRKLGCPMARL